MSQTSQRSLATILLLLLAALLGAVPAAAAPPGSTWTALAALPERLDSPVFALAVNPSTADQVLAGTPTGNLYRSVDGGAHWTRVKQGLGRGLSAIAFDPFKPAEVLAGTRGDGIWRSDDGGQTWQPQPGTQRRSVRAFAFSRDTALAGTDAGVLVLRQGVAWAPAGLTQVAVSALAVPATDKPARLVAGGDGTRGTEALPLFGSGDGGKSWVGVAGAAGGSNMVSALAAGPIPEIGKPRPVLMGTNIGLFESADNGATWNAVTGGGRLPAVDYTAVAFNTNHTQRFYAASDGGGSDRGGLWATTDGGATFSSLKPPVPTVTALAVSADQAPMLYAAAFQPGDHAVTLWAYHDTGGAPRGPAGGAPAAGPGARSANGLQAHHPPAAAGPLAGVGPRWLSQLITGPEAPYLLLGVGAIVVLLLALVSYLRRTRGI